MSEREIAEDVRRAAIVAVVNFETRIQSGEFEGLDPDGTDARDALIAEVQRVILAERERCAKMCEAQKEAFLSPEYASNQPLGSLLERFACDECATSIRQGSPK